MIWKFHRFFSALSLRAIKLLLRQIAFALWALNCWLLEQFYQLLSARYIIDKSENCIISWHTYTAASRLYVCFPAFETGKSSTFQGISNFQRSWSVRGKLPEINIPSRRPTVQFHATESSFKNRTSDRNTSEKRFSIHLR